MDILFYMNWSWIVWWAEKCSIQSNAAAARKRHSRGIIVDGWQHVRGRLLVQIDYYSGINKWYDAIGADGESLGTF